MSQWIPQAKDFAKRFKWSIIASIAILFISIVFLINYSSVINESTKEQETVDSSQASASIKNLGAQDVPIILLDNWAVIIDGKRYSVYQKGYQRFVKVDGKEVPLQAGQTVIKDGQDYVVGTNGKFQSANNVIDATPQIGDIVEKDGKLYKVGADGKLHPYKAQLKPGQVVWKDGKAYVVGSDGQLHEVGDKPQAGDLVEKDGKLYKVGADGKLHAYNKPLKAGDIVWKDGKAYVVDPNGNLHLIGDKPQIGDIVEKDGQYYQVGKDGKLHPYLGDLAKGQVVWKDGKQYQVGADGKLEAVTDCTERAINGKPYIYQQGKWVPLTTNGAKPGHFVLGSDQELYKIDPKGDLVASNNMINPNDIVWRGCTPIQISADGQAQDINDGDEVVDSEGNHYIYKNGKLVAVDSKAKDKAKEEKAAKAETSQNDALKDAFKSALIPIKGSNDQDAKEVKKAEENSLDKNILAAQMKALSNPLGTGSEYQTQNDQAGKVAFLQSESDGRTTAKGKFEHPKSKFTMYAGSIINATLQTGLSSDLPGEIIARVDKNIYDSVTGNYILIPQGTTVIGTYDSSIAYGQERALIVFTRLLFPDGSSMPLENQPGADLRGFAGLTGTVDSHIFKIFGHALMFSLFSAAGQLSQPNTGGAGGPTDQQIIFAAVGQQFSQTASQMIAKDMNIQPTIKAEPGKGFTILTTRDIVFPSYYHFD